MFYSSRVDFAVLNFMKFSGDHGYTIFTDEQFTLMIYDVM